MAYRVLKSDGSATPLVINDLEINETVSTLMIPGRNTPNYGEPIATSMIRLLENFASAVSPGTTDGAVSSPISVNSQVLRGQLWYKIVGDSGVLHVCKEGGTPLTAKFVPITGDAENPIDIYVRSINAVGGTNKDTCNMVGKFKLSANSSLEATYADLAERFHADKEYDAGTLVELGGECEVTATKTLRSTSVFGVVARNPAYLMNQEAGDNTTHPPIALAGRVETKVFGPVRKGDRLVSSNIEGVATVDNGTGDWKHVIGRALENKDIIDVGLVWVAVGAK